MHLEPLNISETDIFISGGWNLCLFHSKPTPILIQKEFCAFSRRDMDKFVWRQNFSSLERLSCQMVAFS